MIAKKDLRPLDPRRLDYNERVRELSFEVYIHFWVYLLGALPSGWLVFQTAMVFSMPIDLYSLMYLIIFAMVLFLFLVCLRGLVQIGPILVISDRGLYVGAPFCNVGWLEWKDVLRVGLHNELLLIDLSKHRPKQSLPWFTRLMQGLNRVGGKGDLVVPLVLRRGVQLERIVEEIESRLTSERFASSSTILGVGEAETKTE